MYVRCIDATHNPIFGKEGRLREGRVYRMRCLQSPDGLHLYGVKANTVSRAFERRRFVPCEPPLTVRALVWLRERMARKHRVEAS